MAISTTMVAKEDEPKDLEGILSVLEAEFSEKYPKQANRMHDILQSIPDWIYRRLRAQEENGWPNCKHSRVGMVRAAITQYVATEVVESEKADREAGLRDLERRRRRLADKEYELMVYKQQGYSDKVIIPLEEEISRRKHCVEGLSRKLECNRTAPCEQKRA